MSQLNSRHDLYSRVNLYSRKRLCYKYKAISNRKTALVFYFCSIFLYELLIKKYIIASKYFDYFRFSLASRI